jgi:glycerol-3-phosphate acyltransferase PlsY
MTLLAAAGALGYLVGSVPFSFIVARCTGIADVRAVGSGNVGATNVMRSAGRIPGVIALILDLGKGVAAVLLCGSLAGGEAGASVGAVSAVVGHVFPVWLGFRGGKGVATGAGAFIMLAPGAALAGVVGFALALVAFRIVSLASIVASATMAACAFALDYHRRIAWSAAAVAGLVIAMHARNVLRVLRGTESRIGPRQERS